MVSSSAAAGRVLRELHDPPLGRPERVPEGRADELVDAAVLRDEPAQRHLGDVGVVDVAADQRDEAGGGWPSAPAAASRSSCIIRSNDRWKAGQCSRSSARRSFSPTPGEPGPRHPAQTASLQASR